MKISHERQGAVTIVGLRGRWVYDSGLRTELRDHIQRFIEAEQLDVVLDLSGVSFADSAVVGEIASTHIALQRRGGRLVLLNPTEQMSRLLAISRLESVIEIQRSSDA